jgi:hypothetical protein
MNMNRYPELKIAASNAPLSAALEWCEHNTSKKGVGEEQVHDT